MRLSRRSLFKLAAVSVAGASGLVVPERKIWALDSTMITPEQYLIEWERLPSGPPVHGEIPSPSLWAYQLGQEFALGIEQGIRAFIDGVQIPGVENVSYVTHREDDSVAFTMRSGEAVLDGRAMDHYVYVDPETGKRETHFIGGKLDSYGSHMGPDTSLPTLAFMQTIDPLFFAKE